jgi:hypothetical protein
MTKEEKKKFLVELEKNGLYHTAMQSISNDSERRQIKAFVDDVYINLIDSLTNIVITDQEIKSEDDGDIIPNE